MSASYPWHVLLGDHMVLQRDLPVRLRGWAPKGTAVKVTLGRRTDETTADGRGRWNVQLGAKSAGGPHELQVTVGDQTRTFKDVMVGEVWLCSGQSNMQFTVKTAANAAEEIAAATDPLIRHIQIPAKTMSTPQENASGEWRVCSPETVGGFTAVGYFFARKLRQELDVPVGLIHASNGHTPCEAWMSREALKSHRELKPILDRWDAMLAAHPGAGKDLDPYRQAWKEASSAVNKPFSKWYDEARALRKAGKPYPPMPTPAAGVCNPQNPTVLFNGMIAPLVGYGIRGVIFYQGESNAIFGSSYQYRWLLPALIADWRKKWGVGEFPFLYVQIANHDDIQCSPADDLWAELRDSQLEALSTPNTAMVVTIDVGEANAIHPAAKQPVGERLAMAALAKAYEVDVPYSGPIYHGHSIDGDKVRVRFEHGHGGLKLRGDKGFVIAGEDKVWHPAVPVIENDALVLRSPAVSKPVAARYAWAADPPATLFNGAGLPASPFRTDNWPGVTDGHR